MMAWFSDNPSKAWGEKFFLAYTPLWMAGMAALMFSGAGGSWGDLGLNLAMLAIAAPALVVPALVRDERDIGRPWTRTYWFKFNLSKLCALMVGEKCEQFWYLYNFCSWREEVVRKSRDAVILNFTVKNRGIFFSWLSISL